MLSVCLTGHKIKGIPTAPTKHHTQTRKFLRSVYQIARPLSSCPLNKPMRREVQLLGTLYRAAASYG